MTEPSEENLNIQNDSSKEPSIENSSIENTETNLETPIIQATVDNIQPSTEQTDESKAYHLPTNEEILERINSQLNNNPMTDQTQTTPTTETTTTETKPKKAKKEESTPVVVKKDQTILWLSLAVLVVTVGIYFWQNYKKKKEDENTIDLQRQQQAGYEEQNHYAQ